MRLWRAAAPRSQRRDKCCLLGDAPSVMMRQGEMSIQPPAIEAALSGSSVAADDPEFLENVAMFEAEALERSKDLRSTAKWDNYFAIGFGILAPVSVAVATGLTTLTDDETLTASVLLAATVLTAALAAWAPARRASGNWASHADFHLIAGRAGDLRAFRAKYMRLDEAARQLDALRAEFAAAIQSAHGRPTVARPGPSTGDREIDAQSPE